MRGAVVFRRVVPLWVADWIFQDVQGRVQERAGLLSTLPEDPFGPEPKDATPVELVVAVGVTPNLNTTLAAQWEAVARNMGMIDPEMFRRQCEAHGIVWEGAA